MAITRNTQYIVALLGMGLMSFAGLALGGPIQGCNAEADDNSIWTRLRHSYTTHLLSGGEPADPSTASPTVRTGLPDPPVSNPPWPYSVYNEGGTPLIGYENMYYSALMDAVYCGPNGQAWKDSRVTIYGWIEPGANLSTSTSRFNKQTGTGGNYPAAYSYQPNALQFDQAALYFERTPDEIQTSHSDWGFRLALLYGADYKYTFANSILSYQYTEQKHLYGFDPVMYYFDFYFPHFFQGENIRIGRYISIPDIEAQLAPNNITYSHSLLYSYDPYTQNGIVSTTLLNKNWRVQLEISAGNDISPFSKGLRQITPAACVVYTSNSGRDAFYPCMNGLNNQKFGWNNIQHAVATWYHKLDDHWHIDTEAWYMWQKDTPNVLNPQGAALLAADFPLPEYAIGAPSGAQCSHVTAPRCTSHEFAFVNYVNYQHDAHNIWTFRSDFFADSTGQRTGFKGDFLEFDLGYTHWVGDALELRPELRLERQLTAPNAALTGYAYDNPCPRFDASGGSCTLSNGNRIPASSGSRNQAMLAADAIFHF
jgi:hypothetical protein